MRMMSRRAPFWSWLALLPALLAAGCQTRSENPDLSRINLGLAQVTLNPIGAWIADEEGFFVKQGLEAHLTLIRGDTQALQALLAGSVDVVVVGSVAAIGASAEGADVVSLATLGSTMPYLLVSSPKIRSPKGLAGKRIGVSGTGLAVSSAAVEIALREFGLDRKRDGIILIPAGSSSERIMGVSTGGIHATVLSVGQYPRIASLEEEGQLRILADLSKLNIRWDHCYLLTTRRFRDANPETLEGVLKAIVEAHAFILNPENEQAVMTSIVKNLMYEEESVEQIYDYVPSTVARKPYSSREAVRTLVALLNEDFPSLAKVDVDKLLDDSFLRELDESGFIDSLYADHVARQESPVH